VPSLLTTYTAQHTST